MSRSYRKPWITNQGRSKWKAKRAASQAVRKVSLEELGSGCNYKKHYCSWDITDYRYPCDPSWEYYPKCCRK